MNFYLYICAATNLAVLLPMTVMLASNLKNLISHIVNRNGNGLQETRIVWTMVTGLLWAETSFSFLSEISHIVNGDGGWVLPLLIPLKLFALVVVYRLYNLYKSED